MTAWPGNTNMSDIIDKADPPPLSPSAAAGLSARTSVKDLQGDPTNPSSHFHGALFEHLFTGKENLEFYILLGHLLWTIRLNFFSYRY